MDNNSVKGTFMQNISNELTKAFIKSATLTAYTVFKSKNNIRCDPGNTYDIVMTAYEMQLTSWKNKEIKVENFDSVDRLPGLLKDAAIELKYLPVNYGTKKGKNAFSGVTKCDYCGENFEWKDADWRYKTEENGTITRTNKAFCPSCKTQLETNHIVFPIELRSISVEDQEDVFNHLTTPDIMTADCGISFYYPTPTRLELEEEEDNCVVKNETLEYLLENSALRPKWFPIYAEMFMAGKTQKEIADAVNLTESTLSSKLQNFKKQARKYFGQYKIHAREWKIARPKPQPKSQPYFNQVNQVEEAEVRTKVRKKCISKLTQMELDF